MKPHEKSFTQGFILVMILATLLNTVPVGAYTTPTPTPGWYDCGWNYRQSITIDRTKVAGSLTNFPVLISLASDPDLASHARADGYDILFTSSDGTTKLSHQIESYTSGNGALVAWVKIPSITSGSNTIIYMYYGNPGAPSQQNPTAVWNSKFAGVWHLNNSFADSTSNSNNAVNSGSIDTAGEIASGRSFDGTSSYLSMSTSTTLQPAELTVSFWVKRTASWDNKQKYLIWAKGTKGAMENTNGWYLDSYDIGNRDTPINLVVDGMNGFNGPIADPDTYYPLNVWTHIAVTFSSATGAATLYKNGVSQAFSEFGDPESITSTSDPKTLAYANGTYLPAAFDEVRISSTVRSPQWIQTEYNNENSPSTFSSLQAVEKVGDHSTCRIPTPPVAAFSASPTSGKAPLTVTFTDQSTNTPTAWSWGFGDGGSSTLQNPSHIYTAAGTYTVTLTASNGDGSNKVVKSNYITANPMTPPVAGFTADVTTGIAPLTVTFTDQSTNTPTAWSWSFGDTGVSTLQNPSHTYASAGTFTVTLTASNGDGSTTLVKPAYITANPKTPPVAGFTADVTTGNAPLTVTFTDQSTNTPTAWSWDFGDGGSSTLQNPSHTYASAGTFTVTLTASNGDGPNALVKSNYITANPKTPPVAGFTADVTSGNAPLTVTFTDQSTNTPTSWSWDFGDGGVSSLQNPSHTYASAGTYTVTLTASNGDGSNKVVNANYITAALDCGDNYSLVTGSGETVGCVAITNDWTAGPMNTLSATYTLAGSYCLKSADMAIGYYPDSVDWHPSQTVDASTCTHSYTLSSQLGDTTDTAYLYVTVHGVVQKVPSGTASADMDVVVPDNPIYYIMQF